LSARTVVYLSPSVTLFGARQALLALMKALDPARYRPAAVVLDEGPLTDRLRQEGIPVEVVRIGPWRKAKTWPFIPWRVWKIARFCRRQGAALIHANDFWAAPWAVAASRLAARLPVVASVRNCPEPKRVRRYWLHRVDRIHVISRAIRADFGGFPELQNKIRLINSGVDLSRFESAQPGSFRSSVGVGAGSFLVTQAAHVSRRKNQMMLVEALGLLKEFEPRVEVALVGGAKEDEYLASILRRAEELGVADRLHAVGFRDDMPAVYAESNLVALVSVDEGLGLVAAEGMAAGKPVVGTRVGGIPEVVVDGETGLLVEPGDAAALAGAIRKLAADPELRVRMGEGGRKRATELFSAPRLALGMMELYDSLLGPIGRP
jgi:glycosyltransferase involved in cell wall biosynthesis